ncbi:MAG TPA: hypothetical protein VMT85_06465 [Thermoanaerobaculia bacterium]|nr:hypothetical protein [Thermoanaerobaculia bacterium]
MKKTVALVALASLLCLGGTAMASIGTADVVPAATLLIPRFEVDLGSGGGLTTLFSVNNASAESVLAHITLWTELWVPIIDFDVYLTGYDVQSFNVRDILTGTLPQTGSINTLSNRGAFSGPHVNFPGCSNAFGNPTNYGPVPGSFVNLIQQAFTGQPITAFGGACASVPGNTDLARGYITIDSVNECDQQFPDSVDYFIDGANPAAIANNDNVLWGDYFFVDPSENFAQGFTAVHIEADSVNLLGANGSCDPLATFPYTFYCSLAGAGDIPGEDNREALASVYAVRYLQGGAFTGGTSVIAWRDPLTGANAPAANCASLIANVTMGNEQIVRFDEEENPVVPSGGPSGQPDVIESPFPYCTNRAVVGQDITVDADFGWLYLNLNTGPATFNQAYVTVVMDASGLFSVGFDALQLNGLTAFDGRQVNPQLGTGPLPTLTSAPLEVQPLGTSVP